MKKKVATAALVLAAFGSPGSAMAESHWCETCGVLVAAAWVQLGGEVTSVISGAASTVYTALLQATSQIAQELEKHTVAASKVVEVSNAWEMQRDIQRKTIELSQTYTPPTSCCDGTANKGLEKAVRDARTRTAQMVATLSQMSMGQKITSQVLQDAYANHVSKFCSAEDVAQGRCTTVSPQGIGGADLKAGTLFEPADGGMYSPQEAEAAKAYIQYVVDPLPPPPVPDALIGTPQGKQYQMLTAARAASMSVASWSLSRIYASRQVPPAESGNGK